MQILKHSHNKTIDFWFYRDSEVKENANVTLSISAPYFAPAFRLTENGKEQFKGSRG